MQALASRFIGVFGDVERAMTETASAAKLMQVSGTDLNTMMQSIVPAAKNFGTSIEEQGDLVVAASDKYGIASEAIISYLGKTSSVAKEAGLAEREVLIIGGNMANSLGKDLDASSDVLNKTFALMVNNQEKIYNTYRRRPETAGFVKPLIEQIAAGDTGQQRTSRSCAASRSWTRASATTSSPSSPPSARPKISPPSSPTLPP